ncbi:MAG: hypothetical protein ACXAC7_11255 [Candidatus Hodarchaeales archaeon]|jgi:hypothetical protein
MSEAPRNKIVFAAFDDRKGPIPIISSAEKTISNKVAIKSIVSTLSAREGKAKVEGEAIIPFPDEDLLGFIYYVSLDQKTTTGDHRVISLTFLAPSSSANQLYANAATLSQEARDIGEKINENYEYGQEVTPELESNIFSWGASDEVEIETELVEEKPITLFDLYSFFPPLTGFRKYEDPLSYALLAFLHHVPVVLSGPDPKHLFDFANLLQELFHLKELRIELTIPVISKYAAQKIQKIPRADCVLLTDEQFKKSFFSRDPLVIITTYQEFKTPYHKFEEKDLKRIAEWIKKSREMKDEEVARRVIRLELDQINDKLNQLVYLATSDRESSFKEVGNILNTDKEELEFMVRSALRSEKCNATQLNKLLKPSTPYNDVELRLKDTIGMVNV